ncbi:hypothetical protein ACFX14_009045 [Malus domestica]
MFSTAMKKANSALEFRILFGSDPEMSARRALHGPCSVLLVTSRIQKPTTKTETAQGLVAFSRESPVKCPSSAA